ncbi:MAG: peptidase [Paenibacillaceae bacterium]|nr:peptidase [Paenibacillaceae bacterium]
MRLTATLPLIVGLCLMAATAAGCGDKPSAGGQDSPANIAGSTDHPTGANQDKTPSDPPPASGSSPSQPSSHPSSPITPSAQAPDKSGASNNSNTSTPDNEYAVNDNAEHVVAHPDSVAVLVNKQFMLPQTYKPDDLVYPDVPFTYKEKIEKRMMRKVAAEALAKLFAGAKKDGVNLAGVSAYRSYATQTSVFNNYVKKDGKEKAMTYSAVPGHSEHETGLAIDVAGSDGKCAIEDCFAGTKEANWLAKHAAEYGFILRYPKGKEAITGYQYEPWHIRYVGTDISKAIADKGITLEEYYHAIPVTKTH